MARGRGDAPALDDHSAGQSGSSPPRAEPPPRPLPSRRTPAAGAHWPRPSTRGGAASLGRTRGPRPRPYGSQLERPPVAAYCRWRQAEALAAAGGDASIPAARSPGGGGTDRCATAAAGVGGARGPRAARACSQLILLEGGLPSRWAPPTCQARRSGAADGHDVVLHRPEGGGGAGRDPDLAVDVLDVVVGGLRAR